METVELPMVKCPHCKKIFQWDDYYDLASGDEHDCPHCQMTIYIISVNTIITAEISTCPE